MIFPAFIERTGLHTRLQQLRVNPPALQIGQHGGGKPAGLKISNGKWCWNSRGIGGRTALDYLIKVRGMDFVGNVGMIVEELNHGARRGPAQG